MGDRLGTYLRTSISRIHNPGGNGRGSGRRAYKVNRSD
jgi:hypothetical protein